MKVGIFETDHFEVAYTVITLFDAPANQLVVFTTSATYRRLTELLGEKASRHEWVVLDNSGSRFAFLNQLYTGAKDKQLDLLYLNTISSNHLLFSRIINRLAIPRVIVTVHDINCLFASKFSVKPKRLLQHIGKKMLISRVKEFNVISDTMISYLQQKTAGKKIIHNLPGAVFQHQQVPAKIEDHIRLVIPGSIDKKRRDYSLVFDLARAAEERRLPLRLVLLGGYHDQYGRSVYEQASQYRSAFVQLVCFNTDAVEQDEFDRQLNAAHFILVPSVVHTAICYSIPEEYGITKSSGNIFDVVKHAKPFMAPQSLTIPPALESSCFRYSSASAIVNFLQSLLKNKPGYTDWEQKALANSGTYTIAAVRSRNAGLLPGN